MLFRSTLKAARSGIFTAVVFGMARAFGEALPNYWDKDNVHLDKVKLSYWDGQDTNKPTEAFKDFGCLIIRYPGRIKGVFG